MNVLKYRNSILLGAGGLLLLAGALSLYFAGGLPFPAEDQGTRMSFQADRGPFAHEAALYTEYGATGLAFTGHITVSGSAALSITADADGAVVYQADFADVEEQPLDIQVTDLTPNAYYTLRFSGPQAQRGYLYLSTAQSLARHPEPPERPQRGTP